MADLLTTSESSSAIEQLIKNAKEKLYLISPFLQINPLLRTRINDIDITSSTIDIKIVCRTDKINVNDMEFLQGLKNVKILALDNLHAKCYLNQDTAIITSLNLYQYSEQNNREMGIKVDKNVDPNLYDAIYKEVESIMRESKKYEIKMVKNAAPIASKETIKSVKQSQKASFGICIRCGQDIDFNIEKPLCNSCYQSWAKYGDVTYPEKFCHVCGKESKQSYDKPVCYGCYKTLKK